MQKNMWSILGLLCLSALFIACSFTPQAKTKVSPERSQTKASVVPAQTDGGESLSDATPSEEDGSSPTYAGDASIADDGAKDNSEPDAAYSDSPTEASVVNISNTDGGSVESRACCQAHAGAGCEDPAIEACVCAPDVLPDCCTKAWDAFCVEVVRQRYCDPGVRQCVCEQWEQAGCCAVEWTNNFCELTGKLKCNAKVGCGTQ
jgi:hypothetical protein